MFKQMGTDFKIPPDGANTQEATQKPAFVLPSKPKVKLRPAPPDNRQIAVVPLRAIRDKSLHHASIRVLCVLCSYCNRAGITWVSQQRLADDIGVSFRAISRQIIILRKKKYIETLVKGGKLSHSSTTRVIFNESISADDAIGIVGGEYRSPDMIIEEEMKMEKKASKPVKRASKAVKKSAEYLPSQEVKKELVEVVVEHNKVEGIVQEVYRNVFLKEKLINDLDLKGFEWIAMAEIFESELRECLELWLRARIGEPESILEFAKSLMPVETA